MQGSKPTPATDVEEQESFFEVTPNPAARSWLRGGVVGGILLMATIAAIATISLTPHSSKLVSAPTLQSQRPEMKAHYLIDHVTDAPKLQSQGPETKAQGPETKAQPSLAKAFNQDIIRHHLKDPVVVLSCHGKIFLQSGSHVTWLEKIEKIGIKKTHFPKRADVFHAQLMMSAGIDESIRTSLRYKVEVTINNEPVQFYSKPLNGHENCQYTVAPENWYEVE